jgi:selT/selW/selH-like putative selenoprotein
LAQAIVSEFKPAAGHANPVEEIVLVPASKGMYEITVNGQLVYSKLKTGQHIADGAAIQLIKATHVR